MHIVSETIKKACTRGGIRYLGDNFGRIKWYMCSGKKSGSRNTEGEGGAEGTKTKCV